MKKFTFLWITGLMALFFVRSTLAQGLDIPPHQGTQTVGEIHTLKSITATGTLLDSLQLLTARDPLGVTLVNDSLIISSSDGNGNNYFDTYDLYGKHGRSVKQPSHTKWGFRDLAFDGQYILASEDSTIKKISPSDFHVVSFLTNTGQKLHRGLAYDPNEKVIYSTNFSSSHLLKIDAATGKTLKDLGKVPDLLAPYGIAFDPYSNNQLASLWYSTSISRGHFWLSRVDTATGQGNFIYDFSDKLRSDCYVGGLEVSSSIARFSGKTVALELEQHGQKLYFADISNTPDNLPLGMEEVNAYDGSDNTKDIINTDNAVYGDYLYTIRNKALAIYKLGADPVHPNLVKTIPLLNPNKLFQYRNLLFVSDGGDHQWETKNLSVFSLADPLNPAWVSTIEAGGHVLAMAFIGDIAYYVLHGKTGIYPVNIANPGLPVSLPIFYNLPAGAGDALEADTTDQLLFASFNNGDILHGMEVVSTAKMPDGMDKIMEYKSSYTYISFQTLPGGLLAALGNKENTKVSMVSFFHYTSSTCTKERNDYFVVSDTATAAYMKKLGDNTLVVSVPTWKQNAKGLLKSYYYDPQLKKGFEGPMLTQESPIKFAVYSLPEMKKLASPSVNGINDLTRQMYLYVLNGVAASDGVNYGSEKTTVVKVVPKPKPSSKVTLEMKIKPASAGFDGCTTSPSVGKHQYALNQAVSLKATGKPEKGWYFKEWSGDASGTSAITSLKMDGNKTVTANFINLSLYIAGSQKKRLICPDKVEKWQLKMLPFTLTASDADDWEVTAVQVTPSGNGNDLTDLKKVQVYKDGNIMGSAQFPGDDQKVSVKLDHPLTVPAGSAVSLDLRYLFRYDSLKAHATDTVLNFLIKVTHVTAKPKNHPEGAITGGARADTLRVARVINEKQQTGFCRIQRAIDNPKTQNGDTLWVCSGKYPEHIDLNKDLAIIATAGPQKTFLSYVYKGIGDKGEILSVNTARFLLKGFTFGNKNHFISNTIYIDTCRYGRLTDNIINGNKPNTPLLIALPLSLDSLTVDSNEFSLSEIKFLKKDSCRYLSFNANTFNGGASIKFPEVRFLDFSNNKFLDTTSLVLDGFDSAKVEHNITASKMSRFDFRHGAKLTYRFNNSLDVDVFDVSGSIFEKNRYLAIELIRADNSSLVGNSFDNVISVNKSNNIHIEKNSFSGNTLWIENSNVIFIKGNILPEAEWGIWMQNVTQAKIGYNKIYSCAESGVFLENCEKVLLNKNYIHDNSAGIQALNSSGVVISSNRIDKNIGKNAAQDTVFRSGGIGLYRDRNVKVVDNVMVANCTAIRVQHCTHTRLWGNYIQNSLCWFTGVHIENASPELYGNRITGNHGYGILADRGALPVLRNNNISGNLAGGLVNRDAAVTVDAQGNWWGNNSGPANTDVSGNVNAANWQSAPTSAESAPLQTVVYAPKGSADSAIFCYNNLQKSSVQLNATPADDNGWLQTTGTRSLQADDTLGIAFPVKFKVPGNAADGASDRIIVTAVPKTKSGITFSDTVTVYSYTPALQKIELFPDSATLVKNDSLIFTARGNDQHDRFFRFVPQWSAAGGKIDTTGQFVAPSSAGVVTVTAKDKIGTVSGTATVYVADSAPVLRRIAFDKDTVRLKSRQSRMFRAKGYNQYGFPHPLHLKWTATGGKISGGLYLAGTTPGTYSVTATDTLAKVSQSATVVIESATGIPGFRAVSRGLWLGQNRPNPFSGITQIPFMLEKAGFVTLDVFNLQGNRVALLVSGHRLAGQNTVSFNAAGLSAGVYFYRLTDGRYSVVRKMVVR